MKDNLINVKEQGWRALSDSTEYLKTRMQVERSLNISRLVLGKVMKLQPFYE